MHDFLTKSYWSPGVKLKIVKKAMQGSLCFGIYNKDKQIGYARMITDKATFAYLADVFIEEKFRASRGLGKWLVEVILAHPGLQGFKKNLCLQQKMHTNYMNNAGLHLSLILRDTWYTILLLLKTNRTIFAANFQRCYRLHLSAIIRGLLKKD
ncbi:MAG: GNAT family N-acetyltransferase [Chitinophagaceae bacterium]